MCRTFVLAVVLAGGMTCGPVMAQDAQFAYTASPNTGNVVGYRIDSATGTLTPVPGSPFATGDLGASSIAIDQVGRFVYVAGETLIGFSIEPVTGRLIRLPGSPFPASPGTSSIAIDPSGSYAYTVSGGFNSVSGYRIEPVTGRLLPLAGSPFSTGGSYPSFVTVDPLGKFVYVANQYSDNVSGFTINPASGALTPIPGSPFAAGVNSPQSVTLDPLDRFAYVADLGTAVYGYSIDPATGAFTPLNPSFVSGSQPSTGSQSVDPRGKFLYIAGKGLFGYTIDYALGGPGHEPGTLTLIAGSPFGPMGAPAAGVFPVSVAVDYTGTFAYATYYSSGVYAFKIDPASGSLTSVSGSPFPTDGSPPLIALARPRTTPIYSATQVPEPSGGPFTSFTASAINNKGEVTGQAVVPGVDGEFLAETFLYDGTATTGFFVPGSDSSIGNALNDNGEVVGTFIPPVAAPLPALSRAFSYSAGSTAILDSRVGGESSGFGVNNAGHITGSRSTGVCSFVPGLGCTSLGDTHAFLDTGSGLTDIGTLGGNFSEGRGINNRGEITGGTNVAANGPNHVFSYSHGTFRDLGMFEGYSSEGTAINDDGQIIGTAVGPSATLGFVHRDGGFERLPRLDGGANSLPGGINLQGDVVGTSDVASGGATHAFFYHEGKLVDLNDLVQPSLTLLTGAAGINDKGQIVVNGLNGGVYVLTPRRSDRR